MNCTELLAAFDRLSHPHALVLGDLILDRYTWGNAERVSQEAPVILLRADRREARLGGAANVCNMLRGLEADVTVAAAVGDDADGRTLRRLLAEAGVDDACLIADTSRPTTVKERFIGRAANRHPHQILRVDSEVRDPLSADVVRRAGPPHSPADRRVRRGPDLRLRQGRLHAEPWWPRRSPRPAPCGCRCWSIRFAARITPAIAAPRP